MIKVTKIGEDHVAVEVQGTGEEVLSEMCILFSNLRRQNKEFYLTALRYARESNEKESEEDA